jgi:hypothetical protein
MINFYMHLELYNKVVIIGKQNKIEIKMKRKVMSVVSKKKPYQASN